MGDDDDERREQRQERNVCVSHMPHNAAASQIGWRMDISSSPLRPAPAVSPPPLTPSRQKVLLEREAFGFSVLFVEPTQATIQTHTYKAGVGYAGYKQAPTEQAAGSTRLGCWLHPWLE